MCMYIYIYIYFWIAVLKFGAPSVFLDFYFWIFILKIGVSFFKLEVLYVYVYIYFYFWIFILKFGAPYGFLFLNFDFENWSGILKIYFHFWIFILKCGASYGNLILKLRVSFWKLEFHFETLFLCLDFRLEIWSSIGLYGFAFLDFRFGFSFWIFVFHFESGSSIWVPIALLWGGPLGEKLLSQVRPKTFFTQKISEP